MGISIVIPAYQEGDSLARTIKAIYAHCQNLEFEIVVVVDSETDSSVEIVQRVMSEWNSICVLVQDGRGPLNAIKYGIRNTFQDHILVMTADDTDDVEDIQKIYQKFIAGAHYVTASRYIKGGEYSGGPKVKRLFSGAT